MSTGTVGWIYRGNLSMIVACVGEYEIPERDHQQYRDDVHRSGLKFLDEVLADSPRYYELLSIVGLTRATVLVIYRRKD